MLTRANQEEVRQIEGHVFVGLTDLITISHAVAPHERAPSFAINYGLDCFSFEVGHSNSVEEISEAIECKGVLLLH